MMIKCWALDLERDSCSLLSLHSLHALKGCYGLEVCTSPPREQQQRVVLWGAETGAIHSDANPHPKLQDGNIFGCFRESPFGQRMGSGPLKFYLLIHQAMPRETHTDYDECIG
eukprot:scaffold862_cov76-Skeletonema_dohrnii-CCMP3373.AAC.4